MTGVLSVQVECRRRFAPMVDAEPESVEFGCTEDGKVVVAGRSFEPLDFLRAAKKVCDHVLVS